MVPTHVVTVNPPPDEVGLLVSTLSHGHSVNKDLVILVKPLEPAPQMDKGKQPVEEGLQSKRKRDVSAESDESIPGDGLMVDTRR